MVQCAIDPRLILVEAERLLRKFGRGDMPNVTLAFYRKLANLVEQHGDRAYQMVSEAKGPRSGQI